MLNFNRIINNQTATGYIVKSHILPTLINILDESKTLQTRGVIKNISAHDQYWKQMQITYPFYFYTIQSRCDISLVHWYQQ